MKIRRLDEEQFAIEVEQNAVSVIEVRAIHTSHDIVCRTGEFSEPLPEGEPIRIGAGETGFLLLSPANEHERKALAEDRLEAELSFSGLHGGCYELIAGAERVTIQQDAGAASKTLVLNFSGLEGNPTTEPD